MIDHTGDTARTAQGQAAELILQAAPVHVSGGLRDQDRLVPPRIEFTRFVLDHATGWMADAKPAAPPTPPRRLSRR